LHWPQVETAEELKRLLAASPLGTRQPSENLLLSFLVGEEGVSPANPNPEVHTSDKRGIDDLTRDKAFRRKAKKRHKTK